MSGDALSSHSETPLAELSGRTKKIRGSRSDRGSSSAKRTQPTATVSPSATTGARTCMANERGRAGLEVQAHGSSLCPRARRAGARIRARCSSPHITTPARIVRRSRRRGSGAHGPKDAGGTADTMSRRFDGARRATASGQTSAAGGWCDMRAGCRIRIRAHTRTRAHVEPMPAFAASPAFMACPATRPIPVPGSARPCRPSAGRSPRRWSRSARGAPTGGLRRSPGCGRRSRTARPAPPRSPVPPPIGGSGRSAPGGWAAAGGDVEAPKVGCETTSTRGERAISRPTMYF